MRPSPTTIAQVAQLLGERGVPTRSTDSDGLSLPASGPDGVSEIRKVGDLWWYHRTRDAEWVAADIDVLLERLGAPGQD